MLLGRALPRNCIFNRPCRGPHRRALLSHSPLGQDPPWPGFLGAGGWSGAGLSAARAFLWSTAAPWVTGPWGRASAPSGPHAGAVRVAAGPQAALCPGLKNSSSPAGRRPESEGLNAHQMHLNRRRQGQVCQGDQDGFPEEVTVEPPRKAGQE